MPIRRVRPELLLYFILILLAALGNGLSDSVFGNFFKDAYQINAIQRGFIEFPRELPGLVCALVITFLSFLGDLRIALLAQVLSLVGLLVLGFITPPFAMMLVFLFINSFGLHLFMPISDSIGMSLAEPDQVGKRMGQYASAKAAMGFLAAIMVFFGFRTGFFTFKTPVKLIFLIGSAAFLGAVFVAFLLIRRVKPKSEPRKPFRLLFRKEYKYYYLLTILHGVQKQIAYVYGSWVIIDLLLKGADIMALLTIVSSFICIFFMRSLGKWMDHFGIKKMMYADGITFIVVYLLYGFVVWGITAGLLPEAGISVAIIYTLFVLDRLSMQFGMVKMVYLRSISLADSDITVTLSTGTSLDHVVSILAAMAGGYIWTQLGSHWVFFMAALFSLGNLYVAYRVNPEKEQALAAAYRKHAMSSSQE